MLLIGFNTSNYDSCVCIKRQTGKPDVYLLLYVHDMLVASVNSLQVNEVKIELKNRFKMKDFGAI